MTCQAAEPSHLRIEGDRGQMFQAPGPDGRQGDHEQDQMPTAVVRCEAINLGRLADAAMETERGKTPAVKVQSPAGHQLLSDEFHVEIIFDSTT